MSLPILERIAASRTEEIEHVRLIAASGFKGSVAARGRLLELRTEQLREEVPIRCSAVGWRGRWRR